MPGVSPTPSSSNAPGETGKRLESWKEIGGYFGRDARTVQRWEKSLGLPVHRELRERTGAVYAYTDELDAWRKSRAQGPILQSLEADLLLEAEAPLSPAAPIERKQQRVRWVAGGIAVVVSLAVLMLAVSRRSRLENSVSFLPVPFTSLVGSELSPSFSPDGARVAFSWAPDDVHFGLYIKPVDGKPQRAVVGTEGNMNFSPVWSPDGTRLAYLGSADPNNTQVWVQTLATGKRRLIADLAKGSWPWSRSLAWMPGGEEIIIARADGKEEGSSLFLASLKTAKQTRVTQAPTGFSDGFPGVSPDGKTVVFTRIGGGIARIYRLRFDDKKLDPVLPSQTQSSPGAIAVWDSSGGQVIMIQRAGASEFWRLRLDGRASRLAQVRGVIYDLALSGTGMLVYSLAVSDANLWTFSLEPGGGVGAARRCDSLISTYDEYNPRYSPDGKRVAFESNRGGYPEIWVSDRDGGNAAALTHFGGPITGSPAWSPDGRWLAFDSRVDGYPAIFIAPASGGLPKRVTPAGERSVVPSWSRDGKRIYFASPGVNEMQVWSIYPDGTRKTQITKEGGFYAEESLDGRFLYYTREHGEVTPLRRVPVTGGNEIDIAAHVLDRNFAVTRTGIYFASAPLAAPKLNFLSFKDSRCSVLAPFPKSIWYGIDVSPDERELMYGQKDTSGADLQLVKDIR